MSTTAPRTTPAGAAPLDDASAQIARLARRDDLVLGGATVATGLLAGFIYSYACSVIPGLSGASDITFVDAMQQINRAVENPVFFASFMGAPVLAAWALANERRRGTSEGVRWVAWGLGLVVATLTVTFAFNIPLNDALAAAGEPTRIADLAQVRSDFETPWMIWNVVRTVTAVGALGCLARAALLRKRAGR